MARAEIQPPQGKGRETGFGGSLASRFRRLVEPKATAHAMTEDSAQRKSVFSAEFTERLKKAPKTISLSGIQGKSAQEIASMTGTLVVPSGASENERRIIGQVTDVQDRKVGIATGEQAQELLGKERVLSFDTLLELLLRRPHHPHRRFTDGLDELATMNEAHDAVLGRKINPIVAEYLRFVVDRLPENSEKVDGNLKVDIKKAHTIKNMGVENSKAIGANYIVDGAQFFLSQYTVSGGETYRDVFARFIEQGDQLAQTAEIQERMSKTGSTNVADLASELDQIDLDTKATLLMMAFMSNAVRGVIKDPAGYAPREVMRKHLLGEEIPQSGETTS